MSEWREAGTMVATVAGSVFVRAAPGTGPTILLLHGYPSSSFDYRAVLPVLGDRAWLTLDFLGFGLSDKPRAHRYSLLEQADIVESVLAKAISGPVVIVAHDMGTSVATELMARDVQGRLRFELQQVVLTNGSVLLDRASLRPIQRVLRSPLGPVAARLTNERMFRREFGRLFSGTHPLRDEEAAAQWALLAHRRGHRITHLLISYLDERVRYAGRWHGAVRDWRRPVSFLWGIDDPVATTAVLDGLRELRPAADVIELPAVGHYPQVEVPTVFARSVLSLLAARH